MSFSSPQDKSAALILSDGNTKEITVKSNPSLLKKLFIICASIAVLFLAAVFIINIYMLNYASPYIYTSLKDVPSRYTVIIPGARVYQDTVSHVVRDRLEAGAECIKNGKSSRVLISGDHGRKNYDEVNRMKDFMTRIYSVDENIIFTDHAGFSTYETMYRARDIFCVKDAVIVTQEFHAVRCAYIARKLGLDAVVYAAPEITPFTASTHRAWTVRECLARVKTFFLVLTDASPSYLGEQIPITGDPSASWD